MDCLVQEIKRVPRSNIKRTKKNIHVVIKKTVVSRRTKSSEIVYIVIIVRL